jgi:hypothetical protein
MTEPTEKAWKDGVETQVYKVNHGWYFEVVIPHPDNPEMPDQLMTLKCNNEWWARFLENCVHEGLQDPDLAQNLEALPDFRYEG